MKKLNTAKKPIVTKKTAMKYIEYFKTLYDINEHIQPNFWKAVIMLCENPNCDVSKLGINEKKTKCVNEKYYSLEDISIYGVDTVLELAQNIAKKIVENEKNPIDRIEIMQIQDRLAQMEQRIMKNERKQQLERKEMEKMFKKIVEALVKLDNDIAKIW